MRENKPEREQDRKKNLWSVATVAGVLALLALIFILSKLPTRAEEEEKFYISYEFRSEIEWFNLTLQDGIVKYAFFKHTPGSISLKGGQMHDNESWENILSLARPEEIAEYRERYSVCAENEPCIADLDSIAIRFNRQTSQRELKFTELQKICRKACAKFFMH